MGKLLEEPGWALVQGASRGIGAALAKALLACDGVAGVVVSARALDESPAIADLERVGGERIVPVAMDVADEASLARGAQRVAATCPNALRIVINAAGVLHDGPMQPEKRLEDVTGDHLARAFAVNATGPLLTARYLFPCFAPRGRSIFASLSARVGSISDNRLGGWYAYRASKAAQNMITRTLSIELARRLPDCVCVGLHPGTVDTDLSAPFRGNATAQRVQPEQAAANLLGVLAGLGPAHSGRCFAWDGKEIAP